MIIRNETQLSLKFLIKYQIMFVIVIYLHITTNHNSLLAF